MRAQVLETVAVAFYPLVLDHHSVYVMSVWEWDADDNQRVLVRNRVLYDKEDHQNVQNCLRFSLAEVD